MAEDLEKGGNIEVEAKFALPTDARFCIPVEIENTRSATKDSGDNLLDSCKINEKIPEWFEVINSIKQKRLKLLNEYKKYWTITSNWATVEIKLREKEQERFDSINANNVKIENSKIINVFWQNILVCKTLIDNTKFTTIQVPKVLKWKRYEDTYLWGQLLKTNHLPKEFLENRLPREFLEREITEDFINIWQDFIRDRNGEIMVNIPAIPTYDNPKEETDIARECLKRWFNWINIYYTIIFCEIVKEYLWKEYVNFELHEANKNKEWYEEIHKKIKEIEKKFWINFWITTDEFSSYWHAFIELGIYKDRKWNISGFFRDIDAVFGAVGGVSTLSLGWNPGAWDYDFTWRPSI